MKELELEEKIEKTRRVHEDEEVEEGFHRDLAGEYVKDFVYGANDGIITTFAIVAGVAGARLDPGVVLILGFANLFADGLSMAAGNYLGTKSEKEFIESEKEEERWSVEQVPDLEKEEVRRVLKGWGFEGEDLEKAVEIITEDKERWVDFMMFGELELVEKRDGESVKRGLVTLGSFVFVGMFPLIPYVFARYLRFPIFYGSIGLTGLVLFGVGALRVYVTRKKPVVAGLEMLVLGGAVALISYLVGGLIGGLVSGV